MDQVLVFLYLGTGALPLALLEPVVRHRDKPGATGLSVACVGTVLWGLCNGLFLLAGTELAGFVIWNVRVVATSLAVVGWVLAVTEYLGVLRPRPGTFLGLLAVPAVGQLFAWTNQVHHLHYGPETAFAGFASIAANYGPVFYANVAYLYGIILICSALLLAQIVERQGLQRLQSVALLGSVLPPLLLNGVHLTVMQRVDLTSVGLVITMFVLGWALVYGQLLEVVPVARDRLVREMSDPVVTLDTDGRVVDCNPPARDLFEVEGDYTGRPVSEVLSPLPGLLEELEDRDEEAMELSLTREGELRAFELRRSTVRDPSDRSLGSLLVFRDITDRKRRRKELEETNRRLDEFASFVSHDLRNPLQVASGRAELLRETGDMAHVEPLEDSLSRMEEMITDLRTLTEADRESVELRPVPLAEVARTAWSQVDTADATLAVEADCRLAADRELVLHVFENLIRNAVEHGQSGDDGPSVTVGCLDDGFYVADDGPGIPAADRDTILEHGYTTSEEGSGIGLSIVRTVADVHGWSIDVGESPTGGARFAFSGVDVCEASPSPIVEG